MNENDERSGIDDFFGPSDEWTGPRRAAADAAVGHSAPRGRALGIEVRELLRLGGARLVGHQRLHRPRHRQLAISRQQRLDTLRPRGRLFTPKFKP